ncbi:SARP family transcriptional regulator [Streptomyces reniochalinae]|uniref:SARP family transcriptional regulator n=1 Tax=Streptomyces reniochalinae TaxID=2250578 RepID=A0A367F7H3_9ACTN|nr:SARP family transcriptional regulator [Streptomyces reniochalinae]
MRVRYGVLGAVAAWSPDGEALALKGPRHRAVLARLIVARRQTVTVARLVEDLWDSPPDDAVGAVRTFVSALRRALEPERPPRSPSRLLVTEGTGYALRAAPDDVDAWRFEQAVASLTEAQPAQVAARTTEALGWWRGPAYAGFGDVPWARGERARLTELRLHALERRAEARIALGEAARAVPDLDAHVAEHPWREDAWQLLTRALYRTGRQADALSVLRRARATLTEQLGVDPGPRLRRLEEDILRQAEHLDPSAAGTAAQVWAQATTAYESNVSARSRVHLESTAVLMRDLAVTGGGGLESARHHRVAAVAAAEQMGDPELTARVIGVYDVPAIWTRADDPEQSRWLVGAAERTLLQLPPPAPPAAPALAQEASPAADEHAAARCRLLATIAVESRGAPADGEAARGTTARPLQAARQAEEIARSLDDAALLAYALNGTFMQTFHRAGLAARRDAIGAEVVDLAARHGLARYEVLGHLIRLQARCARRDLAGADRHAAAADALAARHELPLVAVLTTWYGALRTAMTGAPEAARRAYAQAAACLDGAGMPGLRNGLPPLALLSVQIAHGEPLTVDEAADWGPYEPWVRPTLLVGQGRSEEARAALRAMPPPPRDLLFEAMWCLVGGAAAAVGESAVTRRALAQLEPAAGEQAGAGSGLLTFGPVAGHLRVMTAALES